MHANSMLAYILVRPKTTSGKVTLEEATRRQHTGGGFGGDVPPEGRGRDPHEVWAPLTGYLVTYAGAAGPRHTVVPRHTRTLGEGSGDWEWENEDFGPQSSSPGPPDHTQTQQVQV